MSALRDIRFLVARRLDEPPTVKAAVLNLLNVLDVQLDAEGWQETDVVTHALRGLELAIIDATVDGGFEVPEDAELTDLDELRELEDSEEEIDE